MSVTNFASQCLLGTNWYMSSHIYVSVISGTTTIMYHVTKFISRCTSDGWRSFLEIHVTYIWLNDIGGWSESCAKYVCMRHQVWLFWYKPWLWNLWRVSTKSTLGCRCIVTGEPLSFYCRLCGIYDSCCSVTDCSSVVWVRWYTHERIKRIFHHRNGTVKCTKCTLY